MNAPKMLDRRKKKKAVACSSCGWQGFERDLIACAGSGQIGEESCPVCDNGCFTIYDDDQRATKAQ
jgi:hypothetical protein